MKVAEIRKKFIEFFALKNHTVYPSSSLIPIYDPTLMFTNAGMVQFKDVFLGFRKASSSRVTSVQRCLRAGGKHNDLKNVGYTARHHTFFEMLGNFSFGDYFKREAIHYAWELLTDVFKLPSEKLLVTVYYQDYEAFDIWVHEIGLPESKVIKIYDDTGLVNVSDNFWSMGETGPCGPSSEIFYDHGPAVFGGPPGSIDGHGDRFVEIWNLVFMQFNRDDKGSMLQLPTPCVDTGMGLERIAAVLQNVTSNYEIDLFKKLIKEAGQVLCCDNLASNSLKVIADHIRAAVFMVADGVVPGKDGCNYVLRRIIRRAVRHGYQLDCRKPFFSLLVDTCVNEMGDAYPMLYEWQDRIKDILYKEEERFFETIAQGMNVLEREMKHFASSSQSSKLLTRDSIFPGEVAFKLHDTYGFPLDLTEDICAENGLVVDTIAFNKIMLKQKELARMSSKFIAKKQFEYHGKQTQFVGYFEHEVLQAKVEALYIQEELLDSVEIHLTDMLQKGQEGLVILDRTPFYSESGGQVGDTGKLMLENVSFIVYETFYIRDGVIAHKGCMEVGRILIGQVINAKIDYIRRLNISRNHSATHLLHFALRRILGHHVQQKGSLVDNVRARFDFLHTSPLSSEELKAIEQCVNEEIMLNTVTKISFKTFYDAIADGAIALFGEKYSNDVVRVIQLGSTKELCGGTHVQSTGELGLFKILSESSVAAGVRRIEAITGPAALEFIQTQMAQLEQVSQILNCQTKDVVVRLGLFFEQKKALENQVRYIEAKNVGDVIQQLKSKIIKIGQVKLLKHVIDQQDPKILRSTALKLVKDLGRDTIIILTMTVHATANIVVCVSQNLQHIIQAHQVLACILKHTGGKGGGNTNVAQAGGVELNTLSTALQSIDFWIKDLLEKDTR